MIMYQNEVIRDKKIETLTQTNDYTYTNLIVYISPLLSMSYSICSPIVQPR